MRISMTLALLCAMIFAVGCDEGQQMAMNVVSEPVASDIVASETAPTETIATEPVATEPEYLSLSLDNALNLTPGIYKFRPASFSGFDGFIGTLEWRSIDLFGDPVIGYPADAPKISLTIELNPPPFDTQLDGTGTLGFARLDTGEFIVDELIVEIRQELRRGKETVGPRGNRYEYTYVVYEGTALENVTNPDRLFEYDE